MVSAALLCMALNIYHEARDQPVAGQVAVGQVVMNRVASSRYPDSVCGVVYDDMQFSWYWDGKSDMPLEPRAWESSVLVARAVLAGSGHNDMEGVFHYHATRVNPFWSKEMTLVAHIGDHVFLSGR